MLQVLAMGSHPEILQERAAVPKVWHKGTWNGRKGRGEPVPYPQGTSLSMRHVWGQTYGMGKRMPRRSPGMAKSKRGVSVPPKKLRATTAEKARSRTARKALNATTAHYTKTTNAAPA